MGINDDGSNPEPSAMLDIKSNSKGFLIPRLSSAERQGINNPANGLMVYDNTTNTFWYYNGNAWDEIGEGGVADQLEDTDQDTRITVEQLPDEDLVRFYLEGNERVRFVKDRIEPVNSSGSVNIGFNAGNQITSGLFNVLLGNSAGSNLTTGSGNVFLGSSAGSIADSTLSSTFVGTAAGQSGDLDFSVSIGAQSGQTATGDRNAFIGYFAGSNSEGDQNIFIGDNVATQNEASLGTFIGSQAGTFNTTGEKNVFVGAYAGSGNREGNDNVAIGAFTGRIDRKSVV